MKTRNRMSWLLITIRAMVKKLPTEKGVLSQTVIITMTEISHQNVSLHIFLIMKWRPWMRTPIIKKCQKLIRDNLGRSMIRTIGGNPGASSPPPPLTIGRPTSNQPLVTPQRSFSSFRQKTLFLFYTYVICQRASLEFSYDHFSLLIISYSPGKSSPNCIDGLSTFSTYLNLPFSGNSKKPWKDLVKNLQQQTKINTL